MSNTDTFSKTGDPRGPAQEETKPRVIGTYNIDYSSTEEEPTATPGTLAHAVIEQAYKSCDQNQYCVHGDRLVNSGLSYAQALKRAEHLAGRAAEQGANPIMTPWFDGFHIGYTFAQARSRQFVEDVTTKTMNRVRAVQNFLDQRTTEEITRIFIDALREAYSGELEPEQTQTTTSGVGSTR